MAPAHAHTRSRFLAVLAYPVAFVVVLMYVARRGVYESNNRNGGLVDDLRASLITWNTSSTAVAS